MAFIFSLIPFYFECGSPAAPSPRYVYDFPLALGKTWKYQHFFASIPRESLGSTSGLTPDTMTWSVSDTATVFGSSCFLISSVKIGDKDSVFGAYRMTPDSGLYFWALDTTFSGQALLKTTASRKFRKYAQLMIPVFDKDSGFCEYTDLKGRLVSKHAAIEDKTNGKITVRTFLDGEQRYRERFSSMGLVERVYTHDRFYDDIRKDTLITIDSLVLIEEN
jgi:hypothetical protein